MGIIAASSIALIVSILGGCNRSQQAGAPSVSERLARGDGGGDGGAEGSVAGRSADMPPGQGRGLQEEDGGLSAGASALGRPVAWVNGEPIERQALTRLLWKSRGLSLLQQLVLRDVARQEARRLGLAVTARDIDREYDITLQAARFDGSEPELLTPKRREQLIEEWTRTRGVTRQELAIAMERQACLRRIVQDRVRITEDMLRQAFARVHGEKAEVRHIQLAAPRVWQQIQQRLAAGEGFDDLVADYSENRLSRRDRGLLPPFTADDPGVPAALAAAAFALEPGQVSNPIEAEGSYHVLKLERRIPADDVTFAEAKAELREDLFARLVAVEMDKLGETLMKRCELRIADRLLREQYKTRQAAGEVVGPPLIGQ